jgi:segregation and condensation protein B
MQDQERRQIIEALIFACDVPLTYTRTREVIGNISPEEFAADVEALDAIYCTTGRSFGIIRLAGGVQLGTKPEYSGHVRRLLKDRLRTRLSRSALESLAIVAYRQPIPRSEIEQVRGVDSGGVIGTLMERNLITVGGRATTPGRPLLYITTQDFLRYFGLNDLDDLPKLRELQGLVSEDPRQVQLRFGEGAKKEITEPVA